MKLCFSTLGCPDWEWGEIISSARDLGFDGIEIRGVGNELYVPAIKQFMPESIAQTRSQLEEKRLAIPCLTSACEVNADFRMNEIIAEAKEYIDTAKLLGTPYVRVLADSKPVPSAAVDVELAEETLIELGAYARQAGVTVLVETNGFFANTAALAGLLERVGGAVAALWDIHHPYRYFGESPEQTIKNIGRYIRHVHIKDSRMEGGKVKYCMIGQGDLPIAKSIKELINSGYDGYFSLEWVKRWHPEMEEPGLSLPLYAQYMNRLGK